MTAEKSAEREGNDVDLREFMILMMRAGRRRMEIRLLFNTDGGSENDCGECKGSVL